ncbi:MAG TPA: hypothetical protein VJU84_08640 [Pyrinomonadaceae bacterium]|nr:hypothetical protein [Pyrinomonadaceae bacterium]
MNERLGQAVEENRQEWFCTLIAYLKVRLWLNCFPNMPIEEFDLAWPAFLDQMLSTATEAAQKALKEKVPMSVNVLLVYFLL